MTISRTQIKQTKLENLKKAREVKMKNFNEKKEKVGIYVRLEGTYFYKKGRDKHPNNPMTFWY